MFKSIVYDWGGANVWIFHLINDFRAPLWDQFMQLGTQLADHSLFSFYLALLGLFAVISLRRDCHVRRLRHWLIVLVVFAIAYVLDGLLLGWLKPLFDFPRPPLALPLGSVHIVGVAELHRSFPSGHASFAMLCAASLWPLLGRVGRHCAVGFVLWAGLSRISLGAHFPADVVAGWLSAAAIVWGVHSSVVRLVPRP